jgi:hypothetical protein
MQPGKPYCEHLRLILVLSAYAVCANLLCLRVHSEARINYGLFYRKIALTANAVTCYGGRERNRGPHGAARGCLSGSRGMAAVTLQHIARRTESKCEAIQNIDQFQAVVK